MSNLELLDRAAAATTCQILQAGGSALAGVGTVGIVTGGVGLVPLATGAAMLLASNYGCSDMPLGDAPSGGGVDGCGQMEPGGYGQLQRSYGSDVWSNFGDAYFNDARVTSVSKGDVYQSGNGQWCCSVRVGLLDGGPEFGYADCHGSKSQAESATYRITPIYGECERPEEPDPSPIPPEMTEPISYTDEITNCNFNLTLQGFAERVPGGPVSPVYLMQQAGEQRNDGGRMGGCNWPDTIFMPSGGGGGGDGPNGPVYLPVPDGPTPPDGPGGVPWWAGPLLGGATNAALQLIGDALKDALGPRLPEGSFTLEAPCDVDEQGQPLTQTWTYPEQKWEERSIAHQITMLEALQTHLNWKTPTCSDKDEKPPLEGQWVTTRWESIEKMDHSGRHLRKLFRYRTKSTRDLGQLSAYWADFTWKSGAVCVIHQGAWWGTPQVWAESEAEGQRVIRHAAAEAGIDPDQVGRWTTSSSRTPRYGMSGTMRATRYKGFPWIASRDGAAWPNTLALQRDP